MDCSPPGSSVHGILQAGILDWVAIPSLANTGLLHCRQILYRLSHQGSPSEYLTPYKGLPESRSCVGLPLALLLVPSRVAVTEGSQLMSDESAGLVREFPNWRGFPALSPRDAFPPRHILQHRLSGWDPGTRLAGTDVEETLAKGGILPLLPQPLPGHLQGAGKPTLLEPLTYPGPSAGSGWMLAPC